MSDRSSTLLDRIRTRWVGLALSLVGIIATIWLAATGQLTLYIHPRYVVFTVVMAVIGALLFAAALLFTPSRASGGHDGHGHDDEDEPVRPLTRWVTAIGAVVLIGATTTAMLAVPPSSLSTGAISAADLGSTSAAASDQAPSLSGGDSTTFTVKDWAALLRQGVTAADLTGLSADVIGFVAPDPAGSSDLFYLARYSITCCAVDAQPIAVPVYLPDWDSSVEEGGWVRVQGTFEDVSAGSPVTALDVADLEQIDEPAEPYVF